MSTEIVKELNCVEAVARDKKHQVVLQLVIRRTPEDALLALKGYICHLAEQRQWREITKPQYSYLPDLLVYFGSLAEEVAARASLDESRQKLHIARTLIDLLSDLNKLHVARDEHETFAVLGKAAMQEILAVCTDDGLKVLHSLVEVRNEDVVKGANRAIKGATTETALYYINALNNREYRGYNDSYHKFRTFFWYCITGKESVYDQEHWAPIIGEVQKHEKRVNSLPMGAGQMPASKEMILGACRKQVEIMCLFVWQIHELHEVIKKIDAPIEERKGSVIEFDLATCVVKKIVIPINTRASVFYDFTLGVETWKPMEIQKAILVAVKTKIKESLHEWAKKYKLVLPDPGFAGVLYWPEKKAEQEPAQKPVPVE